ncbi:uncharacterized protein LOC8287620 [Ricinus communis]|uniref:DUF4408 domain-containing protein n=1 Tax=Ricinus communis TaxID=3988 RepID=B9STZ2_RICCO|nr:uncharacterized protein LOC8287620 [Ricinus communis]EEF32927.1 conserved hypothetical protein [Ricinus communis]|eukprot:XP_002529461.1 uncharacterized protein LOC8287620 [Ricinus communis]
MSKFKKSQVLMLTLLAALLFVTPLLSSSIRPKYLYFIINLLIVALGAEAGLLSAAFSKPILDHDRKHPVPVSTAQDHHQSSSPEQAKVSKTRVVEKSASEKIVRSSSITKVEKVKKCPSMPSLFFIGSGETEVVDQDVVQEHEEEAEEEEVEGISGQELFTKAETFIGNFYKQLKMQREESWKRIHGFYQKAF